MKKEVKKSNQPQSDSPRIYLIFSLMLFKKAVLIITKQLLSWGPYDTEYFNHHEMSKKNPSYLLFPYARESEVLSCYPLFGRGRQGKQAL